jgi:hypothetical protein
MPPAMSNARPVSTVTERVLAPCSPTLPVMVEPVSSSSELVPPVTVIASPREPSLARPAAIVPLLVIARLLALMPAPPPPAMLKLDPLPRPPPPP